MRQRKLAAKKQNSVKANVPDVEIAGYTEEIQKMASAELHNVNNYKVEADKYARKGWGVIEDAEPEEKPVKEIKKVVAAENFEIMISAKDQEKIDKRRIQEEKNAIEEQKRIEELEREYQKYQEQKRREAEKNEYLEMKKRELDLKEREIQLQEA